MHTLPVFRHSSFYLYKHIVNQHPIPLLSKQFASPYFNTQAPIMTQIPEMQWAQVYETNKGPIEYKQIPVPQPGPDEVLVNIKFSGGECFVCLPYMEANLSNMGPLQSAILISTPGKAIGLLKLSSH
jgi:hypothetical protein